MFLRIVELGEIKQLVGFASAAEAVKPHLDAVGHQDLPRARRIDSVVPGLLHWAPTTPRHDSVEIVRPWTLELERRDNLVVSVWNAESTERNIDGTAPNGTLKGETIEAIGIKWRVSKQFAKHPFTK